MLFFMDGMDFMDNMDSGYRVVLAAAVGLFGLNALAHQNYPVLFFDFPLFLTDFLGIFLFFICILE